MAIVLGVFAEALFANLAALQGVDRPVDFTKASGIGGSEILATGALGNCLQGFFVNLNFDPLHPLAAAKGVRESHLGHASGARANRVHLDTLGSGEFGSGERRLFTAIVHAIGQKDDDLRLGLAGSQSIYRQAQTVADRGSVLLSMRDDF